MRVWCFVLAICLGVPSCKNNDTGPHSPSAGLNLRPGVVVLDSLPTAVQVPLPEGLADVAVEGSEIAVLVQQDVTPVLFISMDNGATWARHSLPLEPGADLTPHQMQIQLAGGHVTLIYTRDDGSGAYYQFQDVNLSTNTYTSNPGGIRAGFLSFLSDRIVSYDQGILSPPYDTLGYYRYYSYSLATKTVSFMGGQYRASTPDCKGYPWVSPDGDTFFAYCYASTTLCEHAATVSRSLTPNVGCVPESQWPPFLADPSNIPHRQYFFPSRGLAQAYASGGHAYLATFATLVPGAVAAPIDLGPGTPSYDGVRSSNHDRYAGMITVSDTADRLISVPASGPILNVPIPRSACVGGQYCSGAGSVTHWGYGQVAWIVPLGNDDYLVFYVFYSGDDPGRIDPSMICVSREHAPATHP